jgi:hypothetical protein
MINRKFNGYALPLALIFVAIFSIIIASIGPRSNLYNQTTLNIIDHFKRDRLAKKYLLNYIEYKTCSVNPEDSDYLIACNSTNTEVSVTVSSNNNSLVTTLTYP